MDASSRPMAAILTFLRRFGEVMGGIVLGVLYFVLLGPVAVVSRLLSDPLRKRRPRDTAFVRWEKDNETLGTALRQG